MFNIRRIGHVYEMYYRVCDQKTKDSIKRILGIWKERSAVPAAYSMELENLINNELPIPPELLSTPLDVRW